jgi:hypothetical protein
VGGDLKTCLSGGRLEDSVSHCGTTGAEILQPSAWRRQARVMFFAHHNAVILRIVVDFDAVESGSSQLVRLLRMRLHRRSSAHIFRSLLVPLTIVALNVISNGLSCPRSLSRPTSHFLHLHPSAQLRIRGIQHP